MNSRESIKDMAYSLGADLVGFGNIARCKHAPIKMSPQGIYPEAQSIIVIGIHHPDACIEIGGEEHPQKTGPYSVQHYMNLRLDEMNYKLACHVENLGFEAIPIASSNIWRYNQYKDLNAIFAPDISNIYMPVVAGLADMGFNGLAMTPEYGSRIRFNTIITNAKLEPTPLIEPGSICDNCMLCQKNCPTQALSKEIDGENVLKIENKEYRFPFKNLWRYAWGEHFDLDLDLDIPDKVTEEVILKTVAKHGIRGGEMGQCLKFCLPKNLRSWDRSYSRTPMRKYAEPELPEHESRKVDDHIITKTYKRGAEHVVVHTRDELMEMGIEIDQHYPGAESVVTSIIMGDYDKNYFTPDFKGSAEYIVDSICFDMTRELEKTGYRSLMTVVREEVQNPGISHLITEQMDVLNNYPFCANSVITRKKMAPKKLRFCDLLIKNENRKSYTSEEITEKVFDFAKEFGADLLGVSGKERVHHVRKQILPHFENQTILHASDHSINFTHWKPQITKESRKLPLCDDYLSDSKNVLVLGLRQNKKAIERTAKPPAEAVGPYAYQTYITYSHTLILAARVVKYLESFGYRAAIAGDLLNTGSKVASPRGREIPDLLCNRFAAVSAGLGQLAANGRVVTKEFGLNQRFISIVTDAPLIESKLAGAQIETLCHNCEKDCIKACPTQAMQNESVQFELEGHSFQFNKVEPKKM